LSYLADSQTDKQTNKSRQKHCLLGGGKNLSGINDFTLTYLWVFR